MKVNQNSVAKALILVAVLGVSATAKASPTVTRHTGATSITSNSGPVLTPNNTKITGTPTPTATGLTGGNQTTTQ